MFKVWLHWEGITDTAESFNEAFRAETGLDDFIADDADLAAYVKAGFVEFDKTNNQTILMQDTVP